MCRRGRPHLDSSVALIVTIAIDALLLAFLLATYNRLVSMRNNLRNAW
jgi:hypothetical protein